MAQKRKEFGLSIIRLTLATFVLLFGPGTVTHLGAQNPAQASMEAEEPAGDPWCCHTSIFDHTMCMHWWTHEFTAYSYCPWDEPCTTCCWQVNTNCEGVLYNHERQWGECSGS
jgi:hypothetical protein